MEVSVECWTAVGGGERSDEIVEIEMEDIHRDGGVINGVDEDAKMMDAEGDMEMDDA